PHPRLRDLAARSVEAAWVYRPWRSAFKQRACRPLYAVLTAFQPQWRRKLLPGKNIAVCGGLGEAVRRQEGHDVAHYRVPLRVVEHLVVHLSVPAHLDRRPEAVGERARELSVHHPILPGEQEEQRALDAIPVGDHGTLSPADLAPRARRHHAMHGRITLVCLAHGRVAAQVVEIQVERVGGDARALQRFPHVTPAARVVGPAMKEEGGRLGLRRLVRVIGELGAVRRGEGRHHAGARARRSRSSAAWAARRRTSSRSPGNRRLSARSLVSTATASHTVPTGLSAVPPVGPAIPVTATVQSAENRRWAPAAMARTV